MASDYQNDLYKKLLGVMNITETLGDIFDNHPLNLMKERIESKKVSIQARLKSDIRSKARIQNMANRYINLINTAAEKLNKNYQNNELILSENLENLLDELRDGCGQIEPTKIDKEELFQTDCHFLIEAFHFKRSLFDDSTMLLVDLLIGKNKNDKLYLGTLVQIDTYLDDYEISVLENLLQEGKNYTRLTPEFIQKYHNYRPKLFVHHVTNSESKIVLNSRVYLLMELSNRILHESRSKIFIHISKNYMNIKLDMKSNKFTFAVDYIQAGSFDRFSRLNKIDLSGIGLSDFDGSAFDVLEKLEILNLSYNKLTSFCQLSRSLRKLKNLKLTNNQISCLSENYFENLENLTSLDLAENQIDTISSDAFKGLNSLKFLYMSKNKLENIDKNSLNMLSNLEKLDFSFSNLEYLSPSMFQSLDELKELNIHKGRLKKIDNYTFTGLTHLMELNLSGNKISDISTKAFHGLNNLKKLYLDTNLTEINGLTESFKCLYNLGELNLNDNKITSFKITNFTKLTKLKTLILSNNQIRSQNTNSTGCSSKALVVGINSYKNIFSLLTRSSLCKRIPVPFARQKNLIRNLINLDLSFNNLTHITEYFLKGLLCLEILNLSNNQIEEIEPYSFTFKSLKKLDLSSNCIRDNIYDSLKGINPNANIDLTNNKFVESSKQVARRLAYELKCTEIRTS